MTSVDIIIPCYNAEGTIRETLESVVSQEGVDSIIFVDDGSTDRSLEIARDFERSLKILSGPNRGVAHARNKGLASSRADWVVFLDADDTLTAGTIARRLANPASGTADVIICDWEDVPNEAFASAGRHRSIDWSALETNAELAVATTVWATTAAIMYHRSVIARVGHFRADVSPIEDARFLLDATRQGARLAHSAHVGARYRISANSLSRSNRARFWASILLNGQQIEADWRERGLLDATHLEAILGIYNTAARGLFATGNAAYFTAVAAHRGLRVPQPLHSRIAPPLARLIGMRAARSVLSLAGLS